MKNINILKDLNTLNKLHTSSVESHTTNNGIVDFTCDNAGYVDNVVIEGETLVNLVDYSTLNVEGSNCWTFRLKANTVYTLFNFLNDEDGHTCILNEDLTSLIGWTTDKAYTFLNPIDQKVVPHYNLPGFKIVILEGDHTDKPISYFEGLKSVGQGDKIEVLSRNQSNKNLFYGDVELGYIDNKTGVNGDSVNGVRSVEYIKVDKNTTYTVSDDKGYNVSVNLYGENKSEYFGEMYGKTPYTFTTDDKTYWIRLRTYTGSKQNDTTIKWQLEKGNKSTEYFQPKYDHKQISTTLRSLPNGVKDTIEKRGNKYVKVQRCGEVTLNGNESDDKIIEGVPTVTTYRFGFILSNLAESPSDVICVSDKFSSECNNNWTNDKEQVDQDRGSVNIRISRTKLVDGTKTSIKNWLKSNPITIVYQLATPQIIELPNFNPQTYKGKNTLIVNSGVVQCDVSFDVYEGIRNELDVIKDKVSSLDVYINPNKIDFTSQCELLNGWKVWGKNEFFNAFVVDNCVKVTCLIWQGTTDAYTNILKIPKMYAPTNREFIPMVSDSGSCFTGCLDSDGYLVNESKISDFNWISFNFTYPLSK